MPVSIVTLRGRAVQRSMAMVSIAGLRMLDAVAHSGENAGLDVTWTPELEARRPLAGVVYRLRSS